jgi:hypothetical protein
VEGHGVGQEEHHQDEVRGDELGGELEQDRDAAQDNLADVADEEPEREPRRGRAAHVVEWPPGTRAARALTPR